MDRSGDLGAGSRIPALRPSAPSQLWRGIALGASGIRVEFSREGETKVAGLFHFIRYGVHVVCRSINGMKPTRLVRMVAIGLLLVLPAAFPAAAQTQPSEKKLLWKSVGFAIVKFNDEAPKSWNIYHTEKKGLLLVRLWKRYLLVDMKEQEAYEIDPQTVKQRGEDVEWSPADKPDQPLETPEWKTRDVGSMQLVKFRLGKDGHVLELQIPILINGKPAY